MTAAKLRKKKGSRPRRRYVIIVDPSIAAMWGGDMPKCARCRKPAHPYMVRRPLWARAGMKPAGFLCIPCFEKRIGRPLERRDLHRDYTDVPANHWMHWRNGRLVVIDPRAAFQTVGRRIGEMHEILDRFEAGNIDSKTAKELVAPANFDKLKRVKGPRRCPTKLKKLSSRWRVDSRHGKVVQCGKAAPRCRSTTTGNSG